MKTLLKLQELDLKIEAYRARESEIPKQKEKFEAQKTRLAAELAEREKAFKALQLEQANCEGEIAQKQAQIEKYNQQLYAIKTNDAYQALLHEIDALKKQIASYEERMLGLMVEIDERRTRLDEDRKRVAAEIKGLDEECASIDAELAEAIAIRRGLEAERAPLVKDADPKLFPKYERIRRSKREGAAVVPLRHETCSGCNMTVRAQVVNEVLAGEIHCCPNCGRLLYERSNFGE